MATGTGKVVALLAALMAAPLAAPPAAAQGRDEKPIRVYATEWNRDAAGISVRERARLVEQVLDRWQAAAVRQTGTTAARWRDTFGLQLGMLPAPELQALASANPSNGYFGIVDSLGHSLQEAAQRSGSLQKALGTTTTDLVFRPVNPCRIVDTRSAAAGIVSSAAPRDFLYSTTPGGNFSAQGGDATDCGMAFSGSSVSPLAPRAIAATVTVVTPSGAGNLVIYPAGSTPGTTSALNYSAGAVLANSTVIVGAQGGAADFTVALNGPPHTAHVVVDVVGYYYAPQATALDCVTAQASGNSQLIAPGNTLALTATCQSGYTLTGGGCHGVDATGTTAATDGDVYILRSYQPFDQGTGTFVNQWVCAVANKSTTTSYQMRVRARCCRTPGS